MIQGGQYGKSIKDQGNDARSTGKNETELREEVSVVKTVCCDIVEWRVDYFEEIDDVEKVKETLGELKILLGRIPILFTCRTKQEGGEKEISAEDYINLYREVIGTGNADLVDVEMMLGEEVCSTLLECAHNNNVYVVMSSHDFEKTPDKETLVERFRSMQEQGADVPKIAVMPHNAGDVITLLAATNEFTEKYADRPVISMSMGWLGSISRISMSMGWLGSISRISGEFFGSALTFGAAKHVSAPGQLSVNDVNYILKVLHNTDNE